jgi:hypothetical protein
MILDRSLAGTGQRIDETGVRAVGQRASDGQSGIIFYFRCWVDDGMAASDAVNAAKGEGF